MKRYATLLSLSLLLLGVSRPGARPDGYAEIVFTAPVVVEPVEYDPLHPVGNCSGTVSSGRETIVLDSIYASAFVAPLYRIDEATGEAELDGVELSCIARDIEDPNETVRIVIRLNAEDLSEEAAIRLVPSCQAGTLAQEEGSARVTIFASSPRGRVTRRNTDAFVSQQGGVRFEEATTTPGGYNIGYAAMTLEAVRIERP